MVRLFDPILFFLLTGPKKDLAQQLQFLKVENEILRGKLPSRIEITPREKQRLIKYGKRVGSALRNLISIVTVRTFYRWIESAKVRRRRGKKRGRPITPIDVQKLILRMARENGWGYGRIHGELKKLKITDVAWSTVVKILRNNGLDPGPDRSCGTWGDFVQQHMATLWACDFFTVRTWTSRGIVDLYVLFFIHVKTRRVYVAGVTANPDDTWMRQQARNLAIQWGDEPIKPTHLIHDRDTKFTRDFKAIIESEGVELVQKCIKAPNMNAYAERWVQSVKTECLDHFVFCGEKHLQLVLAEYVDYYNRLRPHQNRRNLTLPVAEAMDEMDKSEAEPPATLPLGKIVRHKLLVGLISHYERKAA